MNWLYMAGRAAALIVGVWFCMAMVFAWLSNERDKESRGFRLFVGIPVAIVLLVLLVVVLWFGGVLVFDFVVYGKAPQ